MKNKKDEKQEKSKGYFKYDGKHTITKTSFDTMGIHRDTGTIYDLNGRDKEGNDYNGFNKNGIHKDTGTIYNKKGIDREGFGKDGFNQNGLHKLTKKYYDEKGYNREGYNKNGNNEREQILEDGKILIDDINDDIELFSRYKRIVKQCMDDFNKGKIEKKQLKEYIQWVKKTYEDGEPIEE